MRQMPLERTLGTILSQERNPGPEFQQETDAPEASRTPHGENGGCTHQHSTNHDCDPIATTHSPICDRGREGGDQPETLVTHKESPPVEQQDTNETEVEQPEHGDVEVEAPKARCTASISTTPNLLTDELNFPKLPSPTKQGKETRNDQRKETHQTETTEQPHFIWRSKPTTLETSQPSNARESGKCKQAKILDSTPITRQGYRTSRLVEDFWVTLMTPNTPISTRKTL